jgi:hypothetical protein
VQDTISAAQYQTQLGAVPLVITNEHIRYPDLGIVVYEEHAHVICDQISRTVSFGL